LRAILERKKKWSNQLAVIWDNTIAGKRYEVRTAGNSVRLYTNGIFHSQWNPNAPLSGSLWDLLALPAFLSSAAPRNGAVLGVGGGAVLNQLTHFFPTITIKGIDLDAEHLKLSRRFFGTRKKGVELIHAKAQTWVKEAHLQAAKYDYLVEDLFLGETNDCGIVQPVRAVEASVKWMENLTNLLSDDGTLVMNFESLEQCRHSEGIQWARRAGFSRIFALARPMYQNAIAVICKNKPLRNVEECLHRALEKADVLPSRYRSNILLFHVYTIR